MYRKKNHGVEVFLVHPGGPFWAKKDIGAWSMPKGEFAPDENPLDAALREFQEETGSPAMGNFVALTPRRQPSGKTIFAWAFEGDIDADQIVSNTFTMEWPPHSGNMQEYPEVDRAGWFSLDEAKQKIIKGQVGFIEELGQILTDHY